MKPGIKVTVFVEDKVRNLQKAGGDSLYTPAVLSSVAELCSAFTLRCLDQTLPFSFFADKEDHAIVDLFDSNGKNKWMFNRIFEKCARVVVVVKKSNNDAKIVIDIQGYTKTGRVPFLKLIMDVFARSGRKHMRGFSVEGG